MKRAVGGAPVLLALHNREKGMGSVNFTMLFSVGPPDGFSFALRSRDMGDKTTGSK